jgi:hypothetical protein
LRAETDGSDGGGSEELRAETDGSDGGGSEEFAFREQHTRGGQNRQDRTDRIITKSTKLTKEPHKASTSHMYIHRCISQNDTVE